MVLNSLILVAREIDECLDFFHIPEDSSYKSLLPVEVTDARGHHGFQIFKVK